LNDFIGRFSQATKPHTPTKVGWLYRWSDMWFRLCCVWYLLSQSSLSLWVSVRMFTVSRYITTTTTTTTWHVV